MGQTQSIVITNRWDYKLMPEFSVGLFLEVTADLGPHPCFLQLPEVTQTHQKEILQNGFKKAKLKNDNILNIAEKAIAVKNLWKT